MQITKKNNEVYIVQDKIVTLQSRIMTTFKAKVLKNPRERIRLCAHNSDSNPLHEMFIVHTRHTYVRPHKHMGKAESLSILEGRATLLLFDDKGKVTKSIPMGDYHSGLVYFIRIELPVYHSLIITSDYLVFHEVTLGPFDSSHAILAPWSPDPEDPNSVHAFLDALRRFRNDTF